ncbi:MAG: RidA family protein [Lachnospiraceae bacterium]|nr:RidA family protein [Lachnospiraceae bacterium]
MKIEQRLEELGIELYLDIKPIGAYVPFVRTGNLVYISGQGPSVKGQYTSHFGKVGDSISKDEAKEAARMTAVNLIALLKAAVGDLDKVKRIVNVMGYVNSTPDFTEQPYVINGASELLVEVFGEKGKHTRCAMSVNSLPLGMCVEVQLVAEVED